MEIKAGQDGVVLSAQKVLVGGKEEFWVQVKIATMSNPFAANPFVYGATGWVPAAVLKIGTLRKFGDIRFVLGGRKV